jgi:uncharacterized protein YegP (UPF0339 family)
MSLEFYQDNAKEHRWHVLGDGGEVIHACHEGFKQKQGALHNMILNNTMLGIFVSSLAKGGEVLTGDGESDGVYFASDADEKVRWKVRAGNNELVGQSHKGFDNIEAAMNDLIILYTMLSVRVAELASMRASQ